ncbi:hypothetical protein NOCA2680014 [metagenome]|uniref:Uncharacterized protein n=1 Tax=metagenome TaxID=256318 RepID=A0A2P2CCS1_9ZZZZ
MVVLQFEREGRAAGQADRTVMDMSRLLSCVRGAPLLWPLAVDIVGEALASVQPN